jgi:hypothetical protein
MLHQYRVTNETNETEKGQKGQDIAKKGRLLSIP